jgi:large subunit ribosomal protein L4
MIQGALRSALSEKFNGNAITVVDGFPLSTHKTGAFRKILEKFEIRSKLLIIDSGGNDNLSRASRNLEDVKLVRNFEVSVYDLLNHDRLLFSRSAIQKLQEALNS